MGHYIRILRLALQWVESAIFHLFLHRPHGVHSCGEFGSIIPYYIILFGICNERDGGGGKGGLRYNLG